MDLTANESNIDVALRGRGTSLADVLAVAMTDGWTQRKLSAYLGEHHGITLSQFGARQLLQKARAGR